MTFISGIQAYVTAHSNNGHFRYGDGVSWHDAACYRTKQFVCEDSDKMVTPYFDEDIDDMWA